MECSQSCAVDMKFESVMTQEELEDTKHILCSVFSIGRERAKNLVVLEIEGLYILYNIYRRSYYFQNMG